MRLFDFILGPDSDYGRDRNQDNYGRHDLYVKPDEPTSEKAASEQNHPATAGKSPEPEQQTTSDAEHPAAFVTPAVPAIPDPPPSVPVLEPHPAFTTYVSQQQQPVLPTPTPPPRNQVPTLMEQKQYSNYMDPLSNDFGIPQGPEVPAPGVPNADPPPWADPSGSSIGWWTPVDDASNQNNYVPGVPGPFNPWPNDFEPWTQS
jgi:hypothetical protein